MQGEKLGTPWVDENISIQPNKEGLLSGKTFAVKDIFNIKGFTNSLGIPDYKKSHSPATKNAVAIDTFLNSGAILHGLTITDELMFSIKGCNSFFGAPLNPKYPTCFTGGSSSGSASAVASEWVDFAIGSDTGGSVRVPASYCGIFGIRPSHNLDLLSGVHAMAKDFDTVGLFARDSQMLKMAGQILYKDGTRKLGQKIFYATELFNLLNHEVKEAMDSFIGELIAKTDNLVPLGFTDHFPLQKLVEAYKLIQGNEVWSEYKTWIESKHPKFGEDVQSRINFAQSINSQSKQFFYAKDTFNSWKAFLRNKLNDGILLLPTTPTSAPQKQLNDKQTEDIREKTLEFTVLNSLSGLPQVTIPIEINGKGYGISITGGFNTDVDLLNFVSNIA
ncbi:MAG: amidase family protein [Sporolactobacillus sp.]